MHLHAPVTQLGYWSCDHARTSTRLPILARPFPRHVKLLLPLVIVLTIIWYKLLYHACRSRMADHQYAHILIRRLTLHVLYVHALDQTLESYAI